MQELEKIIEEINDWISDYEEGNDFGDFDQFIRGLKRARILIRAHMTEELPRENDPETTSYSKDNDGWIPVDERLPKEGEIVLTTYRTGCGEYDVTPDQWYKSSGWESALDDDIVAWRPLPDPYHPETTKP